MQVLNIGLFCEKGAKGKEEWANGISPDKKFVLFHSALITIGQLLTIKHQLDYTIM